MDWIDEHLNKIIIDDIYVKLSTIAEKMEILGGKLYKYYSFEDEYSLVNLKNNTVHFTKPYKFNDPFDCVISITLNDIFEFFVPKLIDDSIERDAENEELIRPLIKQCLVGEDISESDNKLVQIIKLLMSQSAFREWMMKNKTNQMDQKELQPILIDVFSNEEFRAKYFELIVSDDINNMNLDFSQLSKNEHIKLFMTCPEMIELVAPEIEDEDAKEKMEVISETLKQKNILDKLQKISKITGRTFLEEEKLTEFQIALEQASIKANRHINDNFAITCFSKKSDEILMWSHYANKHTGFCVEYDFSKCTNWTALTTLFPVIYSKNRPHFPMSIFEQSNNFKDITVKEGNDSIISLIRLLLIKSDIWRYEEEWRIIGLQNQLIDKHLLELDIVTKIYLGANISEKNEKEIVDIAKSKGIPVYRYIMNQEQYTLDCVKCECGENND